MNGKKLKKVGFNGRAMLMLYEEFNLQPERMESTLPTYNSGKKEYHTIFRQLNIFLVK